MDDATLSRELSVAFEYSYLHDDWVNPLQEALAGVSAEDALRKPVEEGAMGIWDIVLHVAVWNENIVERIKSGESVRPSEADWPPPPSVPDEAVWERDKARLWDSLDSVRQTIESAPMAQVRASAYGLPDLLCRFIHVAYHVGQITKMRECLGL